MNNLSLNDLHTLESWINVLVISYKNNPSTTIAKTICYYIDRLLINYRYDLNQAQQQNYCKMRRFWFWRADTLKLILANTTESCP